MKNTLLLVTFFAFAVDVSAQAPTVTFTATPSIVCAGGSVTFTNTSTNSPLIWTWYLSGSNLPVFTTFTPPGNPPPVVYKHPGIYYVTCVVKNNSGTDSVTVQYGVRVSPAPQAIIMPPSGGICDTSPKGKPLDTVFFSLVDTSQYNIYSWAPAKGLSCTACEDPAAFPDKTTVYTLTITGLNGCVAKEYDTVTVGYINARITGKDTMCRWSSDTLIASGGSSGGSNKYSKNPISSYLWSTGETTSSIIVSPSVTTSYSLTIVSGIWPCTSQDIFNVNVIYNCPLGVSEISEKGTIKVYPNPSSGVFTIRANGQQPITNSYIEVYNVLGQQVYQSNINSGNTEVNLSRQPPGIYLYRVVTQTSNLVGEGKIVLQR